MTDKPRTCQWPAGCIKTALPYITLCAEHDARTWNRPIARVPLGETDDDKKFRERGEE